MSHQPNRQFSMVGNNNDTTFTKIFVGGLAWETQRDTVRWYFEQFGDILEAVVITDKNTGRSKGYGFVTFKDPESAMRACQNPSPIIDGRRANCNLASLGAHKPRPSTPQHGRFRPGNGSMAPPAYQSSTPTYLHQPTGQFPLPYSAYGYAGYSQDSLHPMNYYGIYGGQQFSPFLTTTAGGSGGAGMYHSFIPFYAQYAQNNQAQHQQQQQQPHSGFNVHYPHWVQYPYLTQPYGSAGILSLPPTSIPIAAAATTASTTTAATVVTGTAASTNAGPTGGVAVLPQGASSEQNSSSS